MILLLITEYEENDCAIGGSKTTTTEANEVKIIHMTKKRVLLLK